VTTPTPVTPPMRRERINQGVSGLGWKRLRSLVKFDVRAMGVGGQGGRTRTGGMAVIEGRLGVRSIDIFNFRLNFISNFNVV